jgi:N-methylhydantoinase B/oxoprolinase/acetone carboxylase alpha subunit
VTPPPGLFGGGSGAVNRFGVIRDGKDRTFKDWFGIPSSSKFSNMPLQAGDVLVVTQGGGGGYGDPLSRDPALVAADVRDGYVSLRCALEDYGVIFNDDGRMIDMRGTEKERATRLRDRPAIQ